MKIISLYLFTLLLFISVQNKIYAQEGGILDSITTSVTYTSDIFANTTGGIDTGVRYLDNLDIEVESNWNDFTFFVYGLANQGGSISELVGDIQTVSNIEADNSWRIYEAWVNIPLNPIKSSLLVGLYDLNSEFDVINTGGLFLNSSHGIGPDLSSSGITGPSIFPVTSLAARLKVNLIPGVTLKGAIFDAVPSDPLDTQGTKVRIRESEGSLMIGEISWFKRPEGGQSIDRGVNEDSPFRIAAGLWKYSEERLGWDGELQLDAGFYAIAEARVYSEKGDQGQGLALFARFGATNDEINQFASYLGTGLTYTGLLPGRDMDQFGIAASLPMNGDPYLQSTGLDFADEFIAEITYLWQISGAFSLQLDAQYIANPNQDIDLDDAILVGLRTSIGF